MPKEYVYSAIDEREMVTAEGPVENPREPFRVKIGWNREAGYVQIATVDENDGHDGTGFFVELDRWRINELIRHLRKARDQSFGRDE